MRLILSRHGDTFSANDSVVWVGRQQNLPLVDSGIRQAERLARSIQHVGVQLSAVYSSPLRRARDYAAIVVKNLNSSTKITIDERLNEIDYGHWSGLTNQQIKEKGGASALLAWEDFSIWPENIGWFSSPEQMTWEVKSFTEELLCQYQNEETVLLVSSNGRLRYFLQLIPHLFGQALKNKSVKIATGNVSCFFYNGKQWYMEFWNRKPEYLRL